MKHKTAGTLYLLLFCVLFNLGAYELPLLLQERYMLANVEVQPISTTNELARGSFDFSIFNGDFPLIIHANPTEISLYSGSPTFIPAFLSFGTTNQIGYMDAYKTHTPLALISVGWRSNILHTANFTHEGLFAAWGYRFGFLSGGFGFHFADQTLIGSLGASFKYGSINFEASKNSFETHLTIRTKGFWSFSTGLAFDNQGNTKVTFGIGLSHNYYPAGAMENTDWDIKIAHRGSLLEAPENTISAFEWALEQPQFVAIETDIKLTAEGNFILIHDPLLLRYRHGLGKISDFTTQELQTLDMGAWFSSDFAGERVMDLAQLAQLANANPDVYWLLEIKDSRWTEENVINFLTQIDQSFMYPEMVAFYGINNNMVALLQKYTDRPVGIQLDTHKKMLFYSDFLLPLIKLEYRQTIGHADFFTILSSKFDLSEPLKTVADEMEIPLMFWNFHDTIYGYIPENLKIYPLGMPKMEWGKTLK